MLYVSARLFMGAANDFWLVAEFIGLMLASNVLGGFVVPVLCARRLVSKKGLERSTRYLVDLNWSKNPPSKGTILMLRLSGIDWHDALRNHEHLGLRRWHQ